nr:retrovirus-related Pol polyprotein from transposon TNT 1-94 [Tanacetum cinerariifolium]
MKVITKSRITRSTFCLKALDEGYSSKNFVRKFLRVLHPKWRAKITAIEDSKDLTSLSLDELIENLKVYEMIIKKDYEIVKDKGERKSLALKAKKESSDEECSTSRSKDEEYTMAVRDFKKFFKRRETVFDAVIQIISLENVQNHQKTRTQEHSSEVLGVIAMKNYDEKAKDETCLVAQASNEENKTLPEISRTVLNDKSLPQKFWCNTVDTSTYILNRILIRAILGKTPFELPRGRKPTLDYFRVFGSKCFILNTKDYLTKFDPNSYEGVFLGYSKNSKAYIILNKHTRKIKESLNVTFDETPPPSKTSPLVDDDLDEEEEIKVVEKKIIENDIKDETLEIDEIVNSKESRNHPLENVIGKLNHRTLRPDIMFSVRLCARFQEAPKTSHIEEKQTARAISTTKAEYVSAEKACQQALWMKLTLINYDVRLNNVLIMCDNKCVIDITKNVIIGCKVMRTLASVEIKIVLILAMPCCLSSSSVRCLESVSKIVIGTDTESEPFEGVAETPESPHIVAPPTCHVEESEGLARLVTIHMAVYVLPVMSPGLSAGIVEVAAMFDLAFRKRFRSSYDSSPSPPLPVRKRYRGTSELIIDTDSEEDEKVGESSDSDSVTEDAKDEGPAVEDEDPAAGDEGLAAGTRAPVGQGSGSAPEPERLERVSTSRQPTLTMWTDPEDNMVYIDVPAYPPPASPAQTPPSPEQSSGSFPISPAPSIVPSPISSPMISLTVQSPIASHMAISTATILVDEDQFIEVEPQDVRELYTRSGQLRMRFSPRDRFRSLENEQERTAVIFRDLWRPVLALEAWAGRVDTQMTDMSQAGYDDHRLFHDMLL